MFNFYCHCGLTSIVAVGFLPVWLVNITSIVVVGFLLVWLANITSIVAVGFLPIWLVNITFQKSYSRQIRIHAQLEL